MNYSKATIIVISIAFFMLSGCSRHANNKKASTKHVDKEQSATTVEESVFESDTNSIDSMVTEEFFQLLQYSYSWISPKDKITHYSNTIQNLGSKGESTVYVYTVDTMYDSRVDGVFIVTNCAWDEPNNKSYYMEAHDCLKLGPKFIGDCNELGCFDYEMRYEIHDSVLTITTKDTKTEYNPKTKSDTLAGFIAITFHYSIRHWRFRYLSSDTVIFGDTTHLCSFFNPQKAHLGYKISDPMQYRDEPPMYNDPRWAYAEEKLWNPEVCAYLCDIAKVSDGYLTEILGILFYESLHNNPETNRRMAEYLASLPISEQEEQLTRLLNIMWLELFEYKSGIEQPIYSDFDTFIKHFPVFNTSYNGQARREYIELINNLPY